MSGTVVGSVESIWRFPVKSMLGEAIAAASFTTGGVVGDRTHAVMDDETGKVVSVKYPKRWGRMFELVAVTDDSGVSIRFPDRSSVPIDDAALEGRLSEFFGRAVSIASSPPPHARFDEAWVRELKDGVDPVLGAATRFEDGEELIHGGQFMSSHNNFFNYGAVHIVTTSTCRTLAAREPNSRFDPHRFRPNLVIETEESGFVENDWPGKVLTIGGVQLAVSFAVPRCVMTTLEQGDLPADRDVLRAITKHNSLTLGGDVPYPCVGVYADVVTEGDLRVGDAVNIGE